MTREQLEDIRKLLDNAMKDALQNRESMINPITSDSIPGVQIAQFEELLHMNKAILTELRYMNDKEGEVNNG